MELRETAWVVSWWGRKSEALLGVFGWTEVFGFYPNFMETLWWHFRKRHAKDRI